MIVPFFDMHRHLAATEALIRESMEQVLTSGSLILGPEVSAFESEFAAYCGVESCLSVANGTDALEIALRAVGCGAGDKVITAANADMYATCAILAVGATPVFADVDPLTGLLDAVSVEPYLAGSKAVIVTHLYGQLAEMDEILKVAAEYNSVVIEDCAQAHGASRNSKRAGSWGAIACFSFYPTKNLGAIGDAGAVVTSNGEIAERLKLLRQYGWVKKYQSIVPFGRNSRMDELQGALLRRKLPLLDGWNNRRREICERYRSALAHKIEFNNPSNDEDFVAHLCVIKTEKRDLLQARLAEKGIDTAVHYPIPAHQQKSIAELVPSQSLPHTVRLASSVLSLPCFPELHDAEVESVIEALLSASGEIFN